MGLATAHARSDRFLLATVLPLGGIFAALISGVLLMLVGLPEPLVGAIAQGLMPAYVVCTALATPLLMSAARRYSGTRRIFAGLVGLAAAVLVCRGLMFLGVVPDPLSHVGEPNGPTIASAIVQEGAMLALFYGTLIRAAFVALGEPGSEPRVGEKNCRQP